MSPITTQLRMKNRNEKQKPLNYQVSSDGGMESYWDSARKRLLACIEEEQRTEVEMVLRAPRQGGRGLRLWLQIIATQNKPLPDSLPWKLVQVYLDEPEALPLHECSGCGVAIPVRAISPVVDEEPAETFFPACPCCGSTTGYYASWNHPQSHSDDDAEQVNLPDKKIYLRD